MSKRNIILLIVILLAILAIVFSLFYFLKPTPAPSGEVEDINFWANFIPFGKSKPGDSADVKTPPENPIENPNIKTDEPENKSILRKVSDLPIAGYGIFMKERFKDVPKVIPTEIVQEEGKPVAPETEFVPALRYIEKAQGVVYQTYADKLDERKFSETIIPRIYEAYFGNNAESIIIRFLKKDNKTIQTYVGNLPKEYLGADSGGANKITGSFLPENISDMSVSPDGSRIFYLLNIADNTVGITYSLETDTKVQVFDSPYSEWLTSWSSDKAINITTKPSSNVPGFMYAIDPEKKDSTKIIAGTRGLTTLVSPDGKKIIYGDNNVSLNMFNTEIGGSSLIGVNTLPEKCVWGTGSDVLYCATPKFIDTQAEYPDSWYRGEVSFSDEIWKIYVNGGITNKIVDPSEIEGGEEVDAIKLGIDKDEKYLFFINKKDSKLWKLNLQ